MKFSEHCDLCENRKSNLDKGLTCGLTDRKPKFKNICSSIRLEDKFQEKLESVNIEFQNIKNKKKSVYLNYYIFLSISFLLIIGGISMTKSTIKSVYASQVTIMIILFGVALLGITYNKLNNYRKTFTSKEFKKNKIDELIKKYGIDYKTRIDFKKKIHGIQELTIEIDYINWIKKRTTTPYKLNC